MSKVSGSKTALVIFAREPKLGKVKTRLQCALPASVVLSLYKEFVKDVLHMAGKVPCNERFIYYAGKGGSIPFLGKFQNRFRLKRQTGRDLGERMFNAFARCRKEGFDRVVIIGTDCLTIDAKEIERVFKYLRAYPCVLGPALDGGYYLIGLSKLSKRVFTKIDWSSDKVLKQTLGQLKNLGYKSKLISKKDDIDNAASLSRVITQRPAVLLNKSLAKQIRKFL